MSSRLTLQLFPPEGQKIESEGKQYRVLNSCVGCVYEVRDGEGVLDYVKVVSKTTHVNFTGTGSCNGVTPTLQDVHRCLDRSI